MSAQNSEIVNVTKKQIEEVTAIQKATGFPLPLVVELYKTNVSGVVRNAPMWQLLKTINELAMGASMYLKDDKLNDPKTELYVNIAPFPQLPIKIGDRVQLKANKETFWVTVKMISPSHYLGVTPSDMDDIGHGMSLIPIESSYPFQLENVFDYDPKKS